MEPRVELYREALVRLDRGERVALATVVSTSGSTPQKAGATLLVLHDGSMRGTIGGGCVEADAWAAARQMMRSGAPLALAMAEAQGCDLAQLKLADMRKIEPRISGDVYKVLKAQLEREDRSLWVAEEMAILESPTTYDMPPEDAWQAMEPLTRLGVALGELDAEIDVPAPIELLGIPAGRISVQRLFYWHVAKAFYRPDLTFDEMNHINFDWFRPLNCHRHTEQEIRKWCLEAGLSIEQLDVSESGLTVVALKE